MHLNFTISSSCDLVNCCDDIWCFTTYVIIIMISDNKLLHCKKWTIPVSLIKSIIEREANLKTILDREVTVTVKKLLRASV